MTEKAKKYRLITRPDFDGLVCALLFTHLEILNDINFVHPKDMQDGKVKVTKDDITTNLPYVEGVHLAFDHHSSEDSLIGKKENYINEADALSAARVVYNYYGGKARFPDISEEIMAEIDKADSARLTMEDVLNPQRWVMLNFIMDARSGFGRFNDAFRISNFQLMMDLMLQAGIFKIEEILALPDVHERVKLYLEHDQPAKDQIRILGKAHRNCVVLDLRDVSPIYVTNRFTIYALFPQCNISIHIIPGFKGEKTVFAIGKSIFKKDSRTDVGELCLKYGGGGHSNAGTCQVPNDQAEKALQEIIARINQDD